MNNSMKVIGLTGGIGSGKSAIAAELLKYPDIRVIFTDDVAKEQMKKGGVSYNGVVAEFGKNILEPSGEIDRKKLSLVVFSDEANKIKINQITHPNVRKYVTDSIKAFRKSGEVRAVFVETALIIEAGYSEFTDEIWYVTAPVKQRISRLERSRGYSREKALAIMENQKSEEEFIACSDYILENADGVLSRELVSRALKERLNYKM